MGGEQHGGAVIPPPEAGFPSCYVLWKTQHSPWLKDEMREKGSRWMGEHCQQQLCLSLPAASLLSSFDFVGIDLKGVFVGIKVLGGIWEGKSGSFMAVNGKLFSVAKGTVVSSKEMLIWKFNKRVIKSDQWDMKVCSNAECQCWEEEVSCERVKTQRVIVCIQEVRSCVGSKATDLVNDIAATFPWHRDTVTSAVTKGKIKW